MTTSNINNNAATAASKRSSSNSGINSKSNLQQMRFVASWLAIAGFAITTLLQTASMQQDLQLEKAMGAWAPAPPEPSTRRTTAAEGPVVPLSATTVVQQQQQPPKLRYDSSDATVMAMAQGYDLIVHQRFVGSLRKTGFNGTIILALEEEEKMKPGVRDYLHSQNVTLATITYVECNQKIFEDHEVTGAKEKEGNTCISPYPDVKIRWGRYPFLRDALKACEKCTGPVLVSDARDTFFQRDPFADGVPEVTGLQFFAEHSALTAGHWFVAYRVRTCKDGYTMHGPMLCSGTTIGSRDAILQYLDIMYEEMKVWTNTEQCFFKSHGGDQAIMNFLYYSGQFDKVGTQIFRPGDGIVNTVGAMGLRYSKGMANHYKELNISYPFQRSFVGANKNTWIGEHFDLTDHKGYFIDHDGKRSRIIHQYDRFGKHVGDWMKKRAKEIYL